MYSSLVPRLPSFFGAEKLGSLGQGYTYMWTMQQLFEFPSKSPWVLNQHMGFSSTDSDGEW